MLLFELLEWLIYATTFNYLLQDCAHSVCMLSLFCSFSRARRENTINNLHVANRQKAEQFTKRPKKWGTTRNHEKRCKCERQVRWGEEEESWEILRKDGDGEERWLWLIKSCRDDNGWEDTESAGSRANTPAGALGAMQTALPWKRMEEKRRPGGGD